MGWQGLCFLCSDSADGLECGKGDPEDGLPIQEVFLSAKSEGFNSPLAINDARLEREEMVLGDSG